jgi:hypothetical protein
VAVLAHGDDGAQEGEPDEQEARDLLRERDARVEGVAQDDVAEDEDDHQRQAQRDRDLEQVEVGVHDPCHSCPPWRPVDLARERTLLHLRRDIERFVIRLDLVVQLDLPAQRVPAQLLDRLLGRMNRQVGDGLPVDGRPTFRPAALLGMDHGQVERGIALLLADRRPHVDAPVAKLDTGLAGLTIIPGDLDPVQAPDRDLLHLARDRVPPIAGQAIDAGTHEKAGAHRLRRAEEAAPCWSGSADVPHERQLCPGT